MGGSSLIREKQRSDFQASKICGVFFSHSRKGISEMLCHSFLVAQVSEFEWPVARTFRLGFVNVKRNNYFTLTVFLRITNKASCLQASPRSTFHQCPGFIVACTQPSPNDLEQS
jgi:hypothetical protein